jgi:hypothetical protein
MLRRAPVVLMLALSQTRCSAGNVQIDSDFPGGNIVVVSSVDNGAHLRPDLRGTTDWWFYWNFRVRGATGRSVRFLFDGRSPIGARGPAVSVDGGSVWNWLGIENVDDRPVDASFRYDFPKDSGEIRFAFCPPYLSANWQRFVKTVQRCPAVSLLTLCQSEKNRRVEVLRIAPTDDSSQACVLLTARHHACESMASYALEGLISAVCRDDETGCWLRKRVEFNIVPFMDKDGVEEGDQGKNRPPHDHWLDYSGTSCYKSVAALRKLIAEQTRVPLRFAMDIHCSYLRESSDLPGCSEQVFFMGSMEPKIAEEARVFQRVLSRERRGPIAYTGHNDLPYGVRWNSEEIATPSSLGWASKIPDIWVATLLEVPYANAGGVAVTPDSARQLGIDLAKALRVYFEDKFSSQNNRKSL